MSANIQFMTGIKNVYAAFNKSRHLLDNVIELYYESNEMRLSAKVNVSTLIQDFISEADFNTIRSIQEDIEVSQGERKSQLEQDIMVQYNGEQVNYYKHFKGNFDNYMDAVAKTVLEEIDDYVDDISEEAFVELYT